MRRSSVRFTNPDSQQTTFDYDLLGRVLKKRLVTTGLYEQYGYDAAGRMTSVESAAGTTGLPPNLKAPEDGTPRQDQETHEEGEVRRSADRPDSARSRELPEVAGFGMGCSLSHQKRLAKQAETAENAGFLQGVSVKTKLKPASRSATVDDVQKEFDVVQTGNDPGHHTVVLPKPVTQSVADRFNNLFR